jgi:hypothetical protein
MLEMTSFDRVENVSMMAVFVTRNEKYISSYNTIDSGI